MNLNQQSAMIEFFSMLQIASDNIEKVKDKVGL